MLHRPQAMGQHHDKSRQFGGCRVDPPRSGDAMTLKTHSALITGPATYLTEQGQEQQMPVGPCMLENDGGRPVDICWGARGQRSAALPVDAVKNAPDNGNLLLLD